MTHEQATQYLSERQKELNISELAQWLGIDTSNLRKALNGQKDSKGTVLKIPKRCLPKLKEYFEWMKVTQ